MSSRLIDRVRGAQARFRQTPGATNLEEYERIKRALHNEIIESLDFAQVGATPRAELADQLRETLTIEVEGRALPLNRMERERLVEEILDDILGLKIVVCVPCYKVSKQCECLWGHSSG